MSEESLKSNKWYGIPRSEIDWYPTIDTQKCIACFNCVKFCKKEVYVEFEGRPKVINPKNCVVGCRGCDSKCPAGAISHPSDEYLAELENRKTDESVSKCCSTCGL